MHKQIHTIEQFAADGGGFHHQLLLLNKAENQTRNEPGDMNARGIWTFEDTFSFCPYSQFSCSYGVANVYEVGHLDRVHALTRKFGKTFVFSIINRGKLAGALLAQPEKFEVLREQESWMTRGKMVYLVGSKT